MALYSNYPIDSTRHMHIYSKHRNRIQYPYTTDFEIPLPNKREVKEENTGVISIDPLYDGYPLEFGYFGSSSNDISNYPNGLQLSEDASSSSNFYSRLIVQDETVYPRDYATIISYDSTTATTGYSKSAIISEWVKGTPNTGNPGSLYSIRKSLPVAQGSCWVMPNPSQVNLVNTGGFAVNVDSEVNNLTSFESDYNTDIDYTAVPVFVNSANTSALSCYGPCMVGIMNKNTGEMKNILTSGYKNGNGVKWKPNTEFFLGNIIYVYSGTETRYYTVIKQGVTGNIEPTSTSLNTVINDPMPVVSGGVQYVYKGTSYPPRKKWLPETHYDIGDVIGVQFLTYVVTATSGLGLSGLDVTSFIYYLPPAFYWKYFVNVNGSLTFSLIHWFSTDPGFGYLVGDSGYKREEPYDMNVLIKGFPITFNWAPNTYVVEGTFGIIPGDINNIMCVYKSGITGDTPPIPADDIIMKNGTAYFWTSTLYFPWEYPQATVTAGYPQLPEDFISDVNKTYSSAPDVSTGINITTYRLTCVEKGTFGSGNTFVTNNDGTVSFVGKTAKFIYHTANNSLKLIRTPRAPYIINPNPFFNRYNIIPWSANASFSTGEYLYYGTLTFDVIQGGITGNTPPTNTYKQTNGTVVITKVSYTDPYKGSLLKITQVEDNDNQFKPYYARISYYNPNTNIVHLETPLPITEKRCLYEILQFSGDNYNPLEYTVNPFFSNISSPVIFYDITLISITLPNLPVYSSNSINVLTSSQPQPFDSYPKLSSLPYIIVVLKNVNSLEQAIPVCSNNPNEYSATFRIPVSDANPNLTSLYTRLSSGDTKTMRYNPNNNLRLTITDPQGNVLLFANPSFFEDFINFVSNNIPYPDTIRYITGNIEGLGLGWVMGDLLPIPPSSSNQVSATFAIKPHM